jgi:hypothetical protein
LECTSISYIIYLESAWNIVRSCPGKIGGILIIDITNCGLNFLTYLSTLKQLCTHGVLQYPEITEKIYIINAGWVISTLWSAVKSFIPARTEEKLEIRSSGMNTQLLEEIFGSNTESYDASIRCSQLIGDTDISPAETVDDAYGIILADIIGAQDPLGVYADSREFLEAARAHALIYSSSSKAHEDRIEAIKLILERLS